MNSSQTSSHGLIALLNDLGVFARSRITRTTATWTSICCLLNHFLYLRPHGVVAGGILFFIRSFFLFFSFANGSSRWLYRQVTCIAQKVGYTRCNFINWVQNLRRATPIKICGPKLAQISWFSDCFATFSPISPKRCMLSTIWKRTFKVQTFLYQMLKKTSVHHELRDRI